MVGQRTRLAGALRRVWAWIADFVEWTSNYDRRRPRIAERSDIDDPVIGWGPVRNRNESLDAERDGSQEPSRDSQSSAR